MLHSVKAPWCRLIGRFSKENRAGMASVLWMMVSFGSALVFKLGSNLVLTRLLAPDAFGLIGTAMAFLTTLEWLSDLGIQPALIRHKEGATPTYLNTGWWISVVRGSCLSCLAIAAAFPLIEFYHRPELLAVLIVLALRPALMALRSPGMPTLRRHLKYRSVFFDEFSQTAAGSVGSVVLACFIPSVWAIVGGTLFGVVTGIVLSYVLCPMRPGRWNREASRELCMFGRKVLLNTLVMALWLNLDRLVGLRFVSAAEMGLYTIAFNLAAVLESLITRTCDVHFSMLSRISDEQQQTAWQQKVCSRVTWCLMPLSGLGVLLGPWVIDLLYDQRYHGAGIILSIFLARQMIRGIGQLQFQHLLARGEVERSTMAYAFALLVQLIVFYPLVQSLGVCGLAVASLISTTVDTAVQALLRSPRPGCACPSPCSARSPVSFVPDLSAANQAVTNAEAPSFAKLLGGVWILLHLHSGACAVGMTSAFLCTFASLRCRVGALSTSRRFPCRQSRRTAAGDGSRIPGSSS